MAHYHHKEISIPFSNITYTCIIATVLCKDFDESSRMCILYTCILHTYMYFCFLSTAAPIFARQNFRGLLQLFPTASSKSHDHVILSFTDDYHFVVWYYLTYVLQVFSSKVFYNGDTGYFEQVFTGGIPGREGLGRGGGGGKGGSCFVTPSASSTSMSTLYLTDDCMGPVSPHTAVFSLQSSASFGKLFVKIIC